MKIINNVSMSEHTSFRTGGMASFFVEVYSTDDLKEVIARAETEQLPYVVLGEGTNVLISDENFEGYVIRPLFMGIDLAENGEVIAGAGEHWDDLVAFAVTRNLSGLETMSFIPGSVGAAPVQNIGAYGSELKDVIDWVEVFDPKINSTRIISKAECRLDYRDSLFKSKDGKNLIITRVAVKLVLGGKPNISYKDLATHFSDFKTAPTLGQVREAVIKIRQNKLPNVKEVGTAGSFFKNPIVSESKYLELAERFTEIPSFPVGTNQRKIPLAWVLDKVCGLNGYREGNVGLFMTQPLVLVNYGGATTDDIKKFAEKISKTVKEKIDLEIMWEVNLI